MNCSVSVKAYKEVSQAPESPNLLTRILRRLKLLCLGKSLQT